MEKKFTASITPRSPRPRSNRLREQGIGGVSATVVVSGTESGSTVMAGDIHTHSNKPSLDEITTDKQGYLHLTQLKEPENDETGEGVIQRLTEKVKAGWADKAGIAHDLDENSPVRDQFLSKTKDERTAFKVASDKGFEVGRYEAGVSGGMLGIDEQTGDSFAEVARLFVRGKAFFEELMVVKAGVLAGKRYVTPGGGVKCTRVDEVRDGAGALTGWRCWFLSGQDGEKVDCCIVKGDQVIAQQFNVREGVQQGVGNRRYWRLVTNVVTDAEGDASGNRYGYVELSATDREEGSDAPAAGDELCQLGNRGDVTRQNAIMISTVDADSPSIKLFSDINDFTLENRAVISFGVDAVSGKVYFRLGTGDAKQFLDYRQDTGLAVAGRISALSTYDDGSGNDKVLGEVLDDRIVDTDVLYTQTGSSTQAPALPATDGSGVITDLKGWSTDAPTWQAGKYIWQTTYVRKGDGSAEFAPPVCISGKDGNDGTSVTITANEVRYSTEHGASQPADDTFTLTAVPPLTAGQYLWSRTMVTYSNGHSTKSYAVSRAGMDGQSGENGASYTPNLLKGSDVSLSGRFYNFGHYLWDERPAVGTECTMTMCACVGGNDTSIGVFQDIGYSLLGQFTSRTEAIKTWKFTIRDDPNTANRNPTFFHFPKAPADGNYNTDTYIKWVTVTLGDTPQQAWIPAASEMVAPVITSTTVTYAKSQSAGQPADSSFVYNSIGDAGVQNGDYLWTRTRVDYSDGNSTTSYSVGRVGGDGADGIPGADGYTHFAYATSADGAQEFSTVPFDGATYIGVCADHTAADPTDPSKYEWSRYKGKDGVDAQSIAVKSSGYGGSITGGKGYVKVNGEAVNGTLSRGLNMTTINRKTLTKVEHIQYDLYASAPAVATNRTNFINKINSLDDSVFVCLTFCDNVTWTQTMVDAMKKLGSLGDIKTDGTNRTFAFIGYKGLTPGYALQAQGGNQTLPPVEVSAYVADGMFTTSATQVGIDRIEEEYYLSTSRTQAIGGSWSTTRPPWEAGRYYWTRSHVYYTDGTHETIGEICATGEQGAAAPTLLVQYSSDGSSWHPLYQSDDVYMRTSTDGGTTWSNATRFRGESYWVTDKWVDASSYDTGKWIPFTGTTLPSTGYNRINVAVQLNSGTKPSWSTHDNGFSVNLDLETQANGWGTTPGRTMIYLDNYAWCASPSPVSYTQMGHRSIPVLWLRGGGRYRVMTSYDCEWTARPDGYTEASETVSPQTSRPTPQGNPVEGKWRKFQWALGTSTAVTGTWKDAPMNASPGQYVWMRSGLVVPPATEPTTWDSATRLTGDTGAAGESVYRLDLSNEVFGVACNSAGTVTGAYENSQASVYRGSTKLSSGVVYSIAQKTGISTASITSAGLVTMSGLTADTAQVVVQAVVDGVTLQSTISVYKVKPGATGSKGDTGAAAVVYSILPSVDSITRSVTGTLSAASLTCTVYKTTGNATRVPTNDKALTYQLLPDTTVRSTTRTNGTTTAITIPASTEAVVFELKDGSTVLDRERIPVLNEGSPVVEGNGNALLNSAFRSSAHWDMGSKCTIEPNTGPHGQGSVVINQVGAGSNTFQGIYHNYQDMRDGKMVINPALVIGGRRVVTASIYAKCDSDEWLKSIDADARLQVSAVDADSRGTSGSMSVSIKPSNAGEWQRFTITVPVSTFRKASDSGEPYAVRIYPYVVKNGHIRLAAPQVEWGNEATEWAPSPRDADYLTEALLDAVKENATFDGGLILASLLRMGYTDPSGIYKVMSGISGLGGKETNPAMWAGGDMVDAADTSNPSAAKFMVRHNGSGYYCGNTVRFLDDHMEVGDSLVVNKNGLYMMNGSDTRLAVTDTPVVADLSAIAQSVTMSTSGNSTKSLPVARTNNEALGGAAAFNVLFFLSGASTTYTFGQAIPKGSTLTGSFKLQFQYQVPVNDQGVATMGCQFNGRVTVLRGSTEVSTLNFGFSMEPYGSTGNFMFTATPKINVAIDVAGTYTVRVELLSGSYSNYVATGNQAGVAITGSGKATLGVEAQTMIGSDGIVSIWPNARLVLKEAGNNSFFGVLVGNYGLRITPAGGFQKTTDGTTWKTASL